LNVYGMPSNAKRPIISILIPYSEISIIRDDPDNASGSPLSIPSKKVMTRFFRKYRNILGF
jgi:hypothetical protein